MSKSKVKPSSTVSRDTLYGRDTYPNGRIIRLMSPHQDWLDWAVQAIEEAAKQEKKTMSHTLDLTQYQWNVGDRVYYVTDPHLPGTVTDVKRDTTGIDADDVQVLYDGGKVKLWQKAYWLRRVP